MADLLLTVVVPDHFAAVTALEALEELEAAVRSCKPGVCPEYVCLCCASRWLFFRKQDRNIPPVLGPLFAGSQVLVLVLFVLQELDAAWNACYGLASLAVVAAGTFDQVATKTSKHLPGHLLWVPHGECMPDHPWHPGICNTWGASSSIPSLVSQQRPMLLTIIRLLTTFNLLQRSQFICGGPKVFSSPLLFVDGSSIHHFFTSGGRVADLLYKQSTPCLLQRRQRGNVMEHCACQSGRLGV